MGPWIRSNHFLKRSSRGQGTVEFTLVLVVSVALVLALSAKIYKPFGEYAKSYMSDYLACLLDRGVLPKLGSGEDVCSESLNLSSGNPLAPKSGSGAKGANGDSSSESEKDKQKKNSSSQDEMSASRSGASANVVGPSVRNRSSSGTRGSDAGGLNDGKTIEVASAVPKATKYYKFVNNGAGYAPNKVIQVQGVGGLLAAEKEKLKKRESKVSKAGVLETAEDLGRPKKLAIKPPERKVAAEREEEPWSFGKLIRFAIIAMILIAIFVFLSGQALQISKSWEK